MLKVLGPRGTSRLSATAICTSEVEGGISLGEGGLVGVGGDVG